MNSLEHLQAFRQSVHLLLGKGRDALFDLMDATLVSRSVSSFAELSLSPVFRRQWSSVYAAIADRQVSSLQLLNLYIQQLPRQEPLVLATIPLGHVRMPRP